MLVESAGDWRILFESVTEADFFSKTRFDSRCCPENCQVAPQRLRYACLSANLTVDRSFSLTHMKQRSTLNMNRSTKDLRPPSDLDGYKSLTPCTDSFEDPNIRVRQDATASKRMGLTRERASPTLETWIQVESHLTSSAPRGCSPGGRPPGAGRSRSRRRGRRRSS